LDLNRITSLILDDCVDCNDHDNEGDVDEKGGGDDDDDDDDYGILIISPFLQLIFLHTAVFSTNDINKY